MSKKKHEPYINFKLALAGKGLTYKDVGVVIDCTESTVMLKINGDSDFLLTEADAICKAFGFSIAIFLPKMLLNR